MEFEEVDSRLTPERMVQLVYGAMPEGEARWAEYVPSHDNPFDPPAGYGILGVRSPLWRNYRSLVFRERDGHPPFDPAAIEAVWKGLTHPQRVRLWTDCEQLAFEARTDLDVLGWPCARAAYNREGQAHFDRVSGSLGPAVGEPAAAAWWVRAHRLPLLARQHLSVRRLIRNHLIRLEVPRIVGRWGTVEELCGG